jgi:transcriptional regulator with XRE-family HTH domain
MDVGRPITAPVELLLLFGANVRQHRRARKWSQDKLAERADVSSQTIGMIERGLAASSFDTVGRIARALEIPAVSLFATSVATPPAGERSRLLHRINAVLSDLNDFELARAARMIEAFR